MVVDISPSRLEVTAYMLKIYRYADKHNMGGKNDRVTTTDNLMLTIKKVFYPEVLVLSRK